MSEMIRLERDGELATVVLDRPERRNALSLAGWRRLGEVLRELDADDALRCVVLRGAGEAAFSAGADIAEFGAERADAAQARHYGETVEAAMRAVAWCRHPTVAMIQGACVGGGLEIASVCDLRFCGDSSRFGIPVNRIGVTMAYGELRALVGLVGRAAALEILLEGRVFGARRARRLGLVNRVFAGGKLERRTRAVVERIAAGAPLVNRWHKRFVRRLADPAPLAEAELAEGWAFADSEDYRIGREAFLSRAEPRFLGR